MVDNLTAREKRMLLLADHADAYVKQEMRTDSSQTADRPDNFGDVGASRRDAFQ